MPRIRIPLVGPCKRYFWEDVGGTIGEWFDISDEEYDLLTLLNDSRKELLRRLTVIREGGD